MDLPPLQRRSYVSLPDNSSFNRSHSHSHPHPRPPPLLPPPSILPHTHHHRSLQPPTYIPPPPPPPPHGKPQLFSSFQPNPLIKERAVQLSDFGPAHRVNQPPPPLPRFPSPPRVTSYYHTNRSQSLRLDDNSRFSDTWMDSSLLPRAPPLPALHHDNHRKFISSVSPHTGNYPNNFQSRLRFREEYMDGGFRDDVNPQLPLWGRKETRLEALDDFVDHEYRYGTGRERYEWNSGRGNRDFVPADHGADFSLNPSAVFDFDMGKYDSYNHNGADLRCHNSILENERNYGHNSAHLRVERPELFKDSGIEDLTRSNPNRWGERKADSYFNRSPRKQHLRKKSVIQRIPLGKSNNNRNRSHDYSHFPKSYHNESNSVGGGNFKGKEIDVHARSEQKIDEDREKSPMELDVLFKSNSLIAKAVKATPSPNIQSNRDLMFRNSKIRKINLSDSPGGPGVNEHLEETESSIDHFDKDLREYGNVDSADKTDKSVPYLNVPTDPNKDLGKFTKEYNVTCRDNISSGGPLGHAANKESLKSVEYIQFFEGIGSDKTPGKRKRIGSSLERKSEGHEETCLKCLSADSPSQAILLDDGLSSSAGVGIVSAVASDFHTDLLVHEKVKSSSVGDTKKHDIINSSELPLSQTSAIVSVSENYCDANVFCEAGLNCDNGVKNSFPDEPVVFKSSLDSLENKVLDNQMEAYTYKNEECRASSSEQRLGRVSKKLDVSHSMNVNSEVSLSNQEDYTTVEGSPTPVSCVGGACVSPCKFESVPRENSASSNPTVQLQHGSVDMGTEGGKSDSVGLDGKAFTGDEYFQTTSPFMEDLPSSSNNISLNVDSTRVLSTGSADRLVHNDSVDGPSNLTLDMQNGKSSQSDALSNGCSWKPKIFSKNPIFGVDCGLASSSSSKTDAKLCQELTSTVNSQNMLRLSESNQKALQNSNSLLDKSTLSNNRSITSMYGAFPGRASVNHLSVGKTPQFNLVSQSRTWHRTGTPSQLVAGPRDYVTSQINLQEEVSKGQNAYVRKGNSLVRKRTAVTIPQRLQASSPSMYHLSTGVDNLKKIRRSVNEVSISEASTLATTAECVTGPERPKTPPLIGTVKLNCMHADHEESACPQADPFIKKYPGERLDPSSSGEGMASRKSSEDLSSCTKAHEDVARSNVVCQSQIDGRNFGKNITYVKRKSNQLVAFSDSGDPSFKSPENHQPLTSDGYYKRRNNQLIRTSIEDNPKQLPIIPCEFVSSERQEVLKNTQKRSSCKRQTGFTKKKFSLVWTLHGTLASKKHGNSGQLRAVRPFLFPWRRATYRNSFKHSSRPLSNDVLASAIRKSKLSFRGRSLKWSKSMERNSRKTNEDMSRAVLAAEKRKGEQNGASLTVFKSRNYVSRKSVYCIKLCPGKQIFCIGSERYRMNPTRKALQRISDEKVSYSEDQFGNKAKKNFVPTRLLIGNDEYVRIGNGNQLVRDPKKRTRTLANEKVRWSLHTARMRLARKKKFCQFFTRFGKCNKDDKRCPYIHDPSKIAVCTKFLNGCCFDSNCKLTHEVIPERMQDCSYFLQGFCSNESCPYRHVNVHPKSPVCEAFLRGYCADGNECRKKHTYVCPAFEATGNCQQGATCKLHHPKTKKKATKSKALVVQKNARGRYFGAPASDIGNSTRTVSKLISGECDEQVFGEDGKFKDFVSLGDSDEAMEEAVVPRLKLSSDSDREEEPSDLQADFDELIKPFQIMKPSGNVVLDSSPAIDSTGEVSGSNVSGLSL